MPASHNEGRRHTFVASPKGLAAEKFSLKFALAENHVRNATHFGHP
jgi:hypothetical protein